MFIDVNSVGSLSVRCLLELGRLVNIPASIINALQQHEIATEVHGVNTSFDIIGNIKTE